MPVLEEEESLLPEHILSRAYERCMIVYPKFFKMDLLSKLAFLSAELLHPDWAHCEKDRVAAVLSTRSGCLEVDKKFDESRRAVASPSLFVYTLPNIMLGEICIRHRIKGEQICFIEEAGNPQLLYDYVSDLLQNRNTDGCICGHAEASGNSLEATLFWVSGANAPLVFNEDNLKKIFSF